jgi:hypothetical protein
MPVQGKNENQLRLPRWLDFRDNTVEELKTKLGENFRDLSQVLRALRNFQIQTQGRYGDNGEVIRWIRELYSNNSPVLWRWNGEDLAQFTAAARFAGAGTTPTVAVVSQNGTNRIRFTYEGNNFATPGAYGLLLHWPIDRRRFVIRIHARRDTNAGGGQGWGVGLTDGQSTSGYGVAWFRTATGGSKYIWEGGTRTSATGKTLFAGPASSDHDPGSVTDLEVDLRELLITSDGPQAVVNSRSRGWNATAGLVDSPLMGTLSAGAAIAHAAGWEGRRWSRVFLGVLGQSGGASSTIDIEDVQILRHPKDYPLLTEDDTGWQPRPVVTSDSSV